MAQYFTIMAAVIRFSVFTRSGDQPVTCEPGAPWLPPVRDRAAAHRQSEHVGGEPEPLAALLNAAPLSSYSFTMMLSSVWMRRRSGTPSVSVPKY
jgi:hypothetical protein